jgi:hypothetical protein
MLNWEIKYLIKEVPMKRRPFLGILVLLTVLSCNRSTPTGPSDPVECEGAGDRYKVTYIRVDPLTNPASVDNPGSDPDEIHFWWYGTQSEDVPLVREDGYTFVTEAVFIPFNNTQSHHAYITDMLSFLRPTGHRILFTNLRTGETFEPTTFSPCTHRSAGPIGEMVLFGKYCDGDIR